MAQAKTEGPPRGDVAFDYDNLLGAVRRRFTVHQYLPDPVPDEIIEKVLEAGRWAPSGANSQPWEFIVVKDRALIEQLGDVIHREAISLRAADPKFNFPNYEYVRGMSCVIVVIADPRTKRIINHPRPPENKEKTFLFSLAACIEHMHLAATCFGLGCTWLTVQETGPYEMEIRALLDIPDPYRVAILTPLGKPWNWPRIPERRRPLAELVHQDRFDRTKLRDDAQLEEFLRTKTLRKGKGSWDFAAAQGEQQGEQP
jgi:5,6-dimethylbenzimidazole synthase